MHERWEQFAVRLGLQARWPSADAFRSERRDAFILHCLQEGMTRARTARHLIEQDAYRVRAQDRGEADYETVYRTVCLIANRLAAQGRIRAEDITRGKPGRPRLRLRVTRGARPNTTCWRNTLRRRTSRLQL